MKNLINEIKKMADEVIKTLGPYHKESAYEEAFMHELRINRLPYERQRNIEIIYKGYSIGIRRPDCILYPKWSGSKKEEFLVEMKAVKNITKGHKRQGEVYLFSLNIPKGIILNFNTDKNESEIYELLKPKKEIKKEIAIPKKKGKINLQKVLFNSAKNVMEYLGTEFFYYDKGKDLYINAIGVELRLHGIEFYSQKIPVLYKSQQVTEYEYEYVFPEGKYVKIVTYKKESDIEKVYDEVKHYNKLFKMREGYILALPEVENLTIILREVN